MKKNLIILSLILIGFGCTKAFRLDERNDPQALGLSQGELGDYFVNIQVQFSKLFEEYNEYNRELARHTAMTGSDLYANAFLPTAFDTGWRIAYTDILINVNSIVTLGTEKNQKHLVGASRVLKAYTFLVLTDMFGDIPYSEALQGVTKSNPKVDSSKSIYEALIADLKTAIKELEDSSSVKINSGKDLFYNGSAENWVKAANSLLVKIYVQQRKAVSGTGSEITSIINSGKYISSANEDFQFKYSISTSPDSRHLLFSQNYITGASDYIGNAFMNYLLYDKKKRDPRLRYYLRRQQITNTTNAANLNCLGAVKPPHYSSSDPFCQLVEGYWGRDHGDASGIPPDTRSRTVWGLYPVGGDFDSDQANAVLATSGGKGAGISPILLASYVDFYLAEAALTMSTGGDAKALLNSAITKSFNKVLNFDKVVGVTIPSSFVVNQAQIDEYIAEVNQSFDAADANGKIGIIAKEFYLAAFGNGFEVYNLYRRTGFPKLQPSLSPEAGTFIRTFKYPSDLVNRNINVKAKTDVQKLFWDTESNDFVK